MCRYFKILVGQLFFVSVIAFIFDKLFELPNWINFIIPAWCFILFFIGMQIKENVEKSDDTISSDGTAGTRLVAIFIDGILIPWSLGWFKIIQLDVLMIIISILCIIKGKKYFVSFFQKNNWKKEYWFVFWGCTLMFSGIYSFLSFYEIAPCGVVKVYVRVIFLIILLGITSITLPPDSPVAKFATANYKNLYKGDKM